MELFKSLWRDEAGVVMSTELVLLGTVGVIGATVGLNMVTNSVNAEMRDLAFAIRSLNQSYSFRGYSSCGAYTAGSCFVQQPVSESLAELGIMGRPEAAPPVLPSTQPPQPEAPAPVAPKQRSGSTTNSTPSATTELL